MVDEREAVIGRRSTFPISLIAVAFFASLLGAIVGVGTYVFVVSGNPVTPKDVPTLFSVAVVGLYTVAIMVAIASLTFLVVGKDWVIDMVRSYVDQRVIESELTSTYRSHGRLSFALWQMSQEHDHPRRFFLDEAIALARNCYEGKIDYHESVTENMANNLAYFLAERSELEPGPNAILDKKEALSIAERLMDEFYPYASKDRILSRYADTFVSTYAFIVSKCYFVSPTPRRLVDRALVELEMMLRRTTDVREMEDTKSILEELREIQINLEPDPIDEEVQSWLSKVSSELRSWKDRFKRS